MKSYELVIIGGGPAGLAAALSAKNSRIKSILIIERDSELGGILNQCIHNGFGLHKFNEELTGPEYAARFIEKVEGLSIHYLLNTMVIEITPQKVLTITNKNTGITEIKAKSIILAMGCRERPRGALNIPGYRPSGIFSAGTAQRLVNIEGLMPGKEIVILGSGDIGLIMARRLTLEGARVKCVAEIMPYSNGLKRNIVQCLDDYDIPLRLSHTIVDICGTQRIEGVILSKVDETLKPIVGSEEFISCDTLLLSVGLIPENELSSMINLQLNDITSGPIVNERLETSIEGIFACGNVLHVHDLVDYVSEEAELAGRNAARYIQNKSKTDYSPAIKMLASTGIRYSIPNSINIKEMDEELTIRFRVDNIYQQHYINVYCSGHRILHQKKRIMTPGEMETFSLSKKQITSFPDLEKITLCIEK